MLSGELIKLLQQRVVHRIVQAVFFCVGIGLMVYGVLKNEENPVILGVGLFIGPAIYLVIGIFEN